MDEFKMDEIKQFWEWFSRHCLELGTAYENTTLLKELDERMTSLGFSWELGPGKGEKHAFTISPSGDPDLLPLAKYMVSQAKACPDWEFNYAKPPKDWELTFEFRNDRKTISIDASQWEYVLLQYDDGMFEIIIKASPMLHLSPQERQAAAEILLDGVLGEERRIEVICKIDVVAEFETAIGGRSTPIERLSRHLDSLKMP